MAKQMSLVGLVTFSLLSSTLFASKLSVFQNAFAKSNEAEIHGNATKYYVNGMNSSDSLEAQREGGDSRNQFDADRKLYKPTYSHIKADAKMSFTVYPEKHLYKPGENVTLAGSIWTSLLSELDDHANFVIIEVKDNKRVDVASEEAEIDDNGEYSTTFMLPGDAERGAYKAQATIQVDEDLLETLEPSVRAKLHTSAMFAVVNPNSFAVKVEDREFNVDITTNSTSVKEFVFVEEQSMISFKVAGETGTRGVVQVTLPKELLGEQVVVSIDGLAIAEDSNDVVVTSDTANEMTFEINYQHSEHTIQLHGKSKVPQSPESLTVVSAAFGCVVAFFAIVGIFLSIRYFGRQRQMGKMGPRAGRRFGFPSFPLGKKKGVDFFCMSCGTMHDLRACPNCGSKLKKVDF